MADPAVFNTSPLIFLEGTLGLVLVAKQRGVIREAKPVVERLLAAGMYLSEQVIANALRMVGE